MNFVRHYFSSVMIEMQKSSATGDAELTYICTPTLTGMPPPMSTVMSQLSYLMSLSLVVMLSSEYDSATFISILFAVAVL